MKRNSLEHRRALQLALETLQALRVDMTKGNTYDCKTTGKRYSVFGGRVSAVWNDGHFEKYPFGTFEVIG